MEVNPVRLGAGPRNPFGRNLPSAAPSEQPQGAWPATGGAPLAACCAEERMGMHLGLKNKQMHSHVHTSKRFA